LAGRGPVGIVAVGAGVVIGAVGAGVVIGVVGTNGFGPDSCTVAVGTGRLGTSDELSTIIRGPGATLGGRADGDGLGTVGVSTVVGKTGGGS
jgi:hypothetical protein